jgi:ATP-binding cassette subfamily C (CFTR/MRP) protein 1
MSAENGKRHSESSQADEQNSVERVQHYRELETEAANNLPDDPKPDEAWPTAGAVSFNNVHLRYRPDFPLVLKGLTFDVRPGEKVGIIGRTGAGKSSIAQALFRTVELCEGKIEVDGRDLRNLGLEAVRSRLAIIPQDAFLFGGTVRENIDPTGARTDAELNDAMGLVHRSSSSSAALKEKFNLEGIVANEGSNFSAGERQLRERNHR